MTMNLLSLYNLFIIIITILGIIITYLSFYLTGKTGNNFYIVWRSEAIQIGNDVSTRCQLHRLIKSWEHSWSAESGTTCMLPWAPTKVQKMNNLNSTHSTNKFSDCHLLFKQVQWLCIGLSFWKVFWEALSILVIKKKKYRNLLRLKSDCAADWRHTAIHCQ